jgi:biofilm PGA synthesis N-glycosyltransferase PgaC
MDVLAAIDAAPLYHVALFFYGLYPISMALVWVILALIYFRRHEVNETTLAPADFLPFVSIVIPAFEEESTIGRTLEAVLAIDYPDYEVIVVNDGSGDGTADVVRTFADAGRLRLVDKAINEGKAMALNDAIPACAGEIIVFIDSDILPEPDVLRAMVPHFVSPRVGALTGNPRVGNRGSLLRDLQTLEFTSIISMQRRAQRIWGRVLTVSGAIMAVRRTALLQVGGFSPSMATEDIDLTWKLQRRFWDVRYEPAAIVWMQVPPNLRELWKQRRRWARGLAQVLRKHRSCMAHWKQRRLWPVFGEAVLSILWAYTFLLITAYWIVAHLAGYTPLGSSPLPNLWGMLIATACLTQLLVGALMDRRYDAHLMRYFPVAIFYPIIYWMLMAIITSAYTPGAFFRRPPQLQRWKIRRVR